MSKKTRYIFSFSSPFILVLLVKERTLIILALPCWNSN